MAAENDKLEGLTNVAAPGAWLTVDAPQDAIPDTAMSAVAAMRLVTQELAVEGDPRAEPRHLRHHLDGAGGPPGDRREPPPELHRSRRVPA